MLQKTIFNEEKSFRLKQKLPHIIFVLFRLFFFIGMAYVVLYPVLIMLSRSFRTPDDMLNPQVIWFPQEFTLNNFKIAWEMVGFGDALPVTARIAILSTLFTLITCSMAGYALGRYKMKFKTVIMALAILTIVVPIQTYFIPIFFKFRYFDYFGVGTVLGWITGTPLTRNLCESEFSFYILSVFGMGIRSGLFVLLFYQTFRGLPKELEDAARIDGCNEGMVFLKVMLPNAGAPYLVTLILSLVWYWNDTVYGSILMRGTQLLAVRMGDLKNIINASFGGLQMYNIETNGISETVIYFAAALLFILPPLVMYLIAQKFFMQSVERSGIVG